MVLHNEEVICDNEETELKARWKLVFDGASNAMGHVIGVVLIFQENNYTSFTTRLCFNNTNNMVEYEACIMGIRVAIDLRIKILEVYEDLTLVICQVKIEWETHDHKIIPYCDPILEFMENFQKITFHRILREENQMANALTTLSSKYEVKSHDEAPIIKISQRNDLA